MNGVKSCFPFSDAAKKKQLAFSIREIISYHLCTERPAIRRASR
jgi:hypothetical protein